MSLSKRKSADERTVLLDSLNSAVDMVKNPDSWRFKHYHVGLQAYDAWVKAVNDGFGSSHGNWWNGVVWAECREMASGYLKEVALKHDTVSEMAEELSSHYGSIARLLGKASDKGLADATKIESLREARRTEESCIHLVEKLLKIL